MTFEEMAKKYMVDRGMWPEDADTVAKTLVSDKEGEMYGRWNDETDGYPPMMIPIVGVTVQLAALDWIKDHCPKAFYRPMFEVRDE